MQSQGTPVLDRPASMAGVGSPVIGRGRWFEPGRAGVGSPVIGPGRWFEPGRGALLRVELPLSADEMTAALYSAVGVEEGDLAADEDVWGQVAVEIATQGLTAVQRRDGAGHPGRCNGS